MEAWLAITLVSTAVIIACCICCFIYFPNEMDDMLRVTWRSCRDRCRERRARRRAARQAAAARRRIEVARREAGGEDGIELEDRVNAVELPPGLSAAVRALVLGSGCGVRGA